MMRVTIDLKKLKSHQLLQVARSDVPIDWPQLNHEKTKQIFLRSKAKPGYDFRFDHSENEFIRQIAWTHNSFLMSLGERIATKVRSFAYCPLSAHIIFSQPNADVSQNPSVEMSHVFPFSFASSLDVRLHCLTLIKSHRDMMTLHNCPAKIQDPTLP
jgi:hypothetical protein